jgi:hypothetical protein
MRRSTPYRSRGEIIKLSIQSNDVNQCWSSFDAENPNTAPNGRKGVSFNTLKKSLSKNTQISQPSERQKTTVKDFSKSKPKEMRIRIEHKL